MRYSVEARVRMSIAQKGRIVSEEARLKIAQALTGMKQSEATKQKRNTKLRGKKRTAETRAALRAIQVARSGAKPLTAFGKTQYINEWAREYGINTGTLRNRLLRSGMKLEDALIAPCHRGFRKDLLIQL
jgi:hypothetical protein